MLTSPVSAFAEKHLEYAELAFIVASAYANGILIVAYSPEAAKN